MIRNEVYANGVKVERIEVTREPDQTVRFRRWLNDVLSDDRAATAPEVEQVLASEQEERQRTVESAVAAALTVLANARTAGANLVPDLTTISTATFANNTARDNALHTLAASLKTTLVSCLDEMAKVERLLVRATANLYDGTD